MILKKLEIFVLTLITILAVFLRSDQLEGKLTFEWDQARDMQAVATMVETRTPALLGPIVRGEAGGFYLAPAYYYILLPIYLVSGGNPLALSIVSIGADILLIIALYIFLRSRATKLIAGLIVFIWACSPLAIRGALTPWNVSFIPIWTLLFIWTLEQLSVTGRFRYRVIAVFLASFTTSIHFSLVPLAGLTIMWNWKYFTNLSFKQYVYLFIAALIPISTLVVHDLTHHFENTILLKRFLFGVSGKSTSILEIIPLVVEKFGYTIARLFTGEPFTILGITILVILVIYVILFRKNLIVKISALLITILIATLIIYRDTDFAEYYFIPTFVPILLILGYFLNSVTAKLSYKLIAIPTLTLIYFYVSLGLRIRSAGIGPYSLQVKKEVVMVIAGLGYPIEFRTSLPRERNTGFEYLLRQAGVVSDLQAARKAYVYEAKNMELIAPEEARSIILERPIQAFKLVVFSN